MNNDQLNVLIRKNKGKRLSSKYKEMFINAGFRESDLKYVNIEQSDEVIKEVQQIFPSVLNQLELLAGNKSFNDSELLLVAFSIIDNMDECYIFSDDFPYCGMYIMKAPVVKENCLNVAKLGYNNTCFIVEKKFRFSFTINYFDEEHAELRNMFDIQLKLR